MSEEPRPASVHKRRALAIEEYVAGVRQGNVGLLARALTLIESRNKQHQLQAEELLTRLMPHTGGAVRVGITGTPGAGKSTFIESLGVMLVEQGHKVAVLAVDPSSGVTGGSILGDKTRMARLAASPAAFIRPSPSSGAMGGVALKTRETMLVCEAAGFDIVLIETVGVGQSETMVSDMTDCFLAIMIPGAGDELQGIKRGLLELVDVIAVNKADGPNKTSAETAARQYRSALQSLADRQSDQAPDVVTCSALNHQHVDAVWDSIMRFHNGLCQSGLLETLRKKQNLRWLWNVVDEQLRQMVLNCPAVAAVQENVEQQVLRGELPIEAAARSILETFNHARQYKTS